MSTFDPTLLASLPQFSILSAQPLSGGLSNRCWALKLQDNAKGRIIKAVWRPVSKSSQAFGISRQHEHHILQQLHSDQIAPCTIALLEQGLLVEWIEGSVVDEATDNALTDNDLLQIQAEIHSLPVPAWRLDAKSRAAHYWQFIPSKFKSLQLEQIHQSFQQQKVVSWFTDTCCHHDLGRYNIVCQPDGIKRVIDWEYAAAGDPSFDLALTVCANELDVSFAVSAYCQRQGYSDVQRWQQAVQYWLPWCDYLAMLWYYVGAGLWPEPSYLDEARTLQKKLATFSE